LKRPLQFDAEFDLSVLSDKQLAWLTERAQNHHFDTVLLDRIDNEGAAMTIRYDDGIDIHFFVEPDGHPEVEGTDRYR
jgi:hypothetical protein